MSNPASAQDRPTVEHYGNPALNGQPLPFSRAVRVGDVVYLSGAIGRGPDGKPPEGIEAQTLAVFHNVRLVLEDAGASWEDIVDVTVFLTDMKADFPTFNRLYAKHFATNRPTRTTVEVGALPTPICVELKVIAYVKP